MRLKLDRALTTDPPSRWKCMPSRWDHARKPSVRFFARKSEMPITPITTAIRRRKKCPLSMLHPHRKRNGVDHGHDRRHPKEQAPASSFVELKHVHEATIDDRWIVFKIIGQKTTDTKASRKNLLEFRGRVLNSSTWQRRRGQDLGPTCGLSRLSFR